MLWKYIKAAWNAKFGMPVPLNWFILGFIAVMTYWHIGFLLIGAGVEFGYLLFLSTSASFQKMLAKRDTDASTALVMDKINKQLKQLAYEDQNRYTELVDRCQTIIKQQVHETPPATLEDQAQGLSRLANVYLQLLISKNAIEQSPVDTDAPSLVKTIRAVEKKLQDNSLSAETKKSFQSQLDILHQRQQAQVDTTQRLEYVEAELQRIEQQIELLREQTVADTAPAIVSGKIDAVTSTLTGTNDWMKDHKALFGSIDDAWSSPPPIVQVAVEE